MRADPHPAVLGVKRVAGSRVVAMVGVDAREPRRRAPAIVAAIALAAAALGEPGAAQSVRRPDPPSSSVASGLVAHEAAAPAPIADRLPVAWWPDTRTAPIVQTDVRIPAPPDRWLASDKLMHFFLSFGVTGFAWAGTRLVAESGAADRIAPGTAAVAGLAKEISDHRHGWGFSVRDLVWDAAGIVAAMLVIQETG